MKAKEIQMGKKKLLEGLEEMLLAALSDFPELTDMEETALSKTMDQLISETQNELVQQTITSLKAEAPRMLKERHSINVAFGERCNERWMKALNHYEMMVVIASELGESNGKDLLKWATDEKKYAFGAIMNLQPRAILVSEEILCLLQNGFADGALARWRTLHEINVTAMFIAKHGDEVALRYLASFYFNARRSAEQLNEYADRLNAEKISSEDIKELDLLCELASKEVGQEIGRDYDWAQPAIQKTSVTLFDLEKDIEMEHWRPWFRSASQHNHAAHRPPDKLLGMMEAVETALLAGRSNSGFVDPLQLAALSLAQMTSTFLLSKPNLDKVVYSQIMLSLADEIGPLAMNLEATSLKTHKDNSQL